MKLSARLVVALCAAVLGASSFAAAQATAQVEKIGAGVTDRTATPIADLYAKPDSFVGKTVRLEGVVTAVCTEMGCWMALAPEATPEQTVRFKVDHGVGIVFPLSARGKAASAEGTFEKIGADDAEGKNAAAEQEATGAGAAFGAAYQIKATGAVIR
jgi:hypothetical protein